MKPLSNIIHENHESLIPMQIHPSKLPFIAGPFGGLNYGSQCQLPAMRVNFEVALDLSHGGEVSKNVDEKLSTSWAWKTLVKHLLDVGNTSNGILQNLVKHSGTL